MAKVKYDASGDIPETENAPVGIYRAEITGAEARDSNAGNPMVAVEWKLTHSAEGKKIDADFWPVRCYLMVSDERPYAKRAIKEFTTALGLPAKGALDTDKLVGKKAQLKLKSDTDQDGEYQPRVGKVLPLSDASEEEPEPEETEPEAEPEPEEEAIDLGPMDRNELKQFIKEQKLGSLADLGITRATTDDEIRGIIVDAMTPEDEPEDEPEPEPEENAGNADDGYDKMGVPDLRKELKERELATNGAKKVLIARLREDDGAEPF